MVASYQCFFYKKKKEEVLIVSFSFETKKGHYNKWNINFLKKNKWNINCYR